MWSILVDRLKKGEAVNGTMVRFSRDPGIANIVANAGFDFILIDMEHSVYSFETVADIVRVARCTGIATVVRPPMRTKGYLSRIMDCGATGVMVPMTETKEHAIEIRDYCKYRNIGLRGIGGSLGFTDYQKVNATEMVEKSNQSTLIIAQVESQAGIDNIDDIAGCAGIDGIIIGPNDLSDSIGVLGQITSPQVTERIAKVVQSCKTHGKFSGIHTGNIEQLHYWRERGMQLLAYKTDIDVLNETFSAYLQNMKAKS